MASLNTLRTKFGMVLSIVIGLALLAFVLSLKTEMGFSGNDPMVGSINGKKVKYSDYLEAYDRVKEQNNIQDGDPQQMDMLVRGTWQALLTEQVIEPGFEKTGIRVGEAERLGLLRGDYPSQVLAGAFSNPRTGVYDVAAVADFVKQAETNVQARRAWNMLNEQMCQEREVGKFLALVKAGTYVNKLEVDCGVKAANNAFAGKWSRCRYEAVPDSLIQISSSDIQSYYKSHKNMFRQQPSRTISYVVFDVNATDEDMLALENTAKQVGVDFAAAEDVRAFVRANRNGAIADRYVSSAQLAEDEAAALMAGLPYGPVLKNNVWTMSRVVDQKVSPDTLGLRHIVLPFGQDKTADSLLTVLRAGADFAQIAQQYSVYEATAANGGELDKMPFSAFTGEFVTALSGAKLNDIVKIVSGDAIQLIQVTSMGNLLKQLQVASITYPVKASEATRNSIHNAAGTFLLNAKGSLEGFNDAASTAGLTPRVAEIALGERELRGVEDSRDIVRWVSDAKKDDVSEIFKAGDDYVVAILTDIDKKKFASVKKAEEQIRTALLRDKKYDYIAKKAAGSTFEALGSSIGATENGMFDGLNYSMFYIDGVGVDPRLIGAITSTPKAGVSPAPVKGVAGVYVFEVDNITTEQKQTAEAERVRAQSRAENMLQQRSFQAIQEMAEVEDMTAKYF